MWLTGSAQAEGPGFRLGSRLLLHPGIATEIRYDSNIFSTPQNTRHGAVLRLSPTIELTTRERGRSGTGKVQFRLFAGLDYREFLTGDKLVSDHRMFNINAGASATFWPVGRFTLDLFDYYVRTSSPPYGIYPYNIDRNTNEIGLRLRIAPGGGRLELTTGYTFGLDMFDLEQFKDWNLYSHKMSARLAWKFFPKTALWIEASAAFVIYQRQGQAQHPNTYPFRALAGVTGLITTKLNLNIWAGYGNGFYTAGPNVNTGVAGLDLTWRPILLTELTLGYKHDFQNALLGSYYDVDMAYLAWNQRFWRFQSIVRFTYSNNRYQGIGPIASLTDPNNPGTPATDRMDHYIVTSVRLEYPFKDWLSLAIGYDLGYNRPNRVLDAGPNGLVPVNFIKHEAYLRLVLAY